MSRMLSEDGQTGYDNSTVAASQSGTESNADHGTRPADVRELTQHVQQLQMQLQQTSTTLHLQASRKTETVQALENANMEIFSLRDNLIEKDELVTQLAEKLTQISSEYGTLKGNYSELTKQTVMNGNAGIHSGSDISEKQFSAAQHLQLETLHPKDTDVVYLTEQLKVVKEDYQKLCLENNLLKDKANRIGEENYEFANKLDSTKLLNSELEKEVLHLNDEHKSSRSEIIKLAKEIINVKSQKTECEAKIDSLSSKLSMTNSEMESLYSEKCSLADQLNKFRDMNEKMVLEIKSLKEHSESERVMYEHLDSNNRKLSEELKAMKHEHDVALNQILAYQTDFAETESRLSEIGDLFEENHSLRTQNDELYNKINNQKDIIAQQRADIDTVTFENVQLNDQIQSFGFSVEEYRDVSGDWQKEKHELQAEVSDLKSAFTVSQKKNSHYAENFAILNTDIEIIKKDLTSSKLECEVYKSKLAKFESHMLSDNVTIDIGETSSFEVTPDGEIQYTVISADTAIPSQSACSTDKSSSITVLDSENIVQTISDMSVLSEELFSSITVLYNESGPSDQHSKPMNDSIGLPLLHEEIALISSLNRSENSVDVSSSIAIIDSETSAEIIFEHQVPIPGTSYELECTRSNVTGLAHGHELSPEENVSFDAVNCDRSLPDSYIICDYHAVHESTNSTVLKTLDYSKMDNEQTKYVLKDKSSLTNQLEQLQHDDVMINAQNDDHNCLSDQINLIPSDQNVVSVEKTQAATAANNLECEEDVITDGIIHDLGSRKVSDVDLQAASGMEVNLHASSSPSCKGSFSLVGFVSGVTVDSVVVEDETFQNSEVMLAAVAETEKTADIRKTGYPLHHEEAIQSDIQLHGHLTELNRLRQEHEKEKIHAIHFYEQQQRAEEQQHLTPEISDLQQIIKTYVAETHYLMEVINIKHGKVENVVEWKCRLEELNNMLLSDIENNIVINSNAQAEVNGLKNVLHQSECDLKYVQHENELLNWQKNELEIKLTNLFPEVISVKTDKCDLETKDELIRDELETVRDRLDYLESSARDCFEMKEMLESVQEQNNEICKENEGLQEKLSLHIEENKKVLDSLDSVYKENSDLLENLQFMRINSQKLQSELAEYHATTKKLENDLARVKNDKELEYSRFVGEIEDLLEESSAQKTKIKASDAAIKYLTEEIQRLRNYVSNIDVQREEINILTNRNLDLQKHLHVVCVNNEGYVQEITENKLKLETTEKESKALFEKYNNQQNIQEQMQAENSVMLEQIDTLKSQLMQCEHKNKIIVEKLNAQLEALDGENSTLKTQLACLQSELQGCCEQIQLFQNNYAEQTKLTKKLDEYNTELTNENSEYKVKVIYLEKELILLEQQVQLYHNSLTEKVDLKSHLETEINALLQENSSLMTRIGSLEHDIIEMNGKETQLKDQIKTYEESCSSSQRKLGIYDNIVSELELQKIENKKLQVDFDKSWSVLESNKVEMQKLKDNLETVHQSCANLEKAATEYEVTYKEMQCALKDKDDIVNDAAAQVYETELCIQTINAEKCSLQDLLQSTSEENIKMKSSVQTLTTSNDTLTAQHCVLDLSREKLDTEKVELDYLLQSIKNENEKLMLENSEMKASQLSSSDKILKLETELIAETNQLNVFLGSVQERINKTEHIIEEKINLESRNTDLNDKIEELYSRLEQIKNEKEILEKLTTDLTGMLHDMQTKYEEVKSEMENTKKKCDNDIGLLQIQLQTMNKDVQDLRELLDLMENEMCSASQEKAILKKHLEQAVEQKQKLEEILTEKHQKDLKNQRTLSLQMNQRSDMNFMLSPAMYGSDKGSKSSRTNGLQSCAEVQTDFTKAESYQSGSPQLEHNSAAVPSDMPGEEIIDMLATNSIHPFAQNTNVTEPSECLNSERNNLSTINGQHIVSTSVISSECQTDTVKFHEYLGLFIRRNEQLLQHSSVHEMDAVTHMSIQDEIIVSEAGYETPESFSELQTISESALIGEESCLSVVRDEEGFHLTETKISEVRNLDNQLLVGPVTNLAIAIEVNDLDASPTGGNSKTETLNQNSNKVNGTIEDEHVSGNFVSEKHSCDQKPETEPDLNSYRVSVTNSSCQCNLIGLTFYYNNKSDSQNESSACGLFDSGMIDKSVQTEVEPTCINKFDEKEKLLEREYDQKAIDLEIEVEDRLNKQLDFRELKVKLLEDNYEKKVKQSQYEIEERSEQLFRQREVEIILDTERDKREHAKVVEQDAIRKIEQIKIHKDQQFVKTLREVREDFFHQHRLDIMAPELEQSPGNALSIEYPVGDATNQGPDDDTLLNKLNQENQELAMARDALLQRINLSQQNQQQIHRQLQNIMADNKTETAQEHAEIPSWLDWDLSPEISFGSVTSSHEPKCLSGELDINLLCSKSGCLSVRNKYEQLVERIQKFQSAVGGDIAVTDIQPPENYEYMDFTDSEPVTVDDSQSKYIEHCESDMQILERITSIDLEHSVRIPPTPDREPQVDKYVNEAAVTVSVKSSDEIDNVIIDHLIAEPSAEHEGHFSFNESDDEINYQSRQQQSAEQDGVFSSVKSKSGVLDSRVHPFYECRASSCNVEHGHFLEIDSDDEEQETIFIKSHSDSETTGKLNVRMCRKRRNGKVIRNSDINFVKDSNSAGQLNSGSNVITDVGLESNQEDLESNEGFELDRFELKAVDFQDDQFVVEMSPVEEKPPGSEVLMLQKTVLQTLGSDRGDFFEENTVVNVRSRHNLEKENNVRLDDRGLLDTGILPVDSLASNPTDDTGYVSSRAKKIQGIDSCSNVGKDFFMEEEIDSSESLENNAQAHIWETSPSLEHVEKHIQNLSGKIGKITVSRFHSEKHQHSSAIQTDRFVSVCTCPNNSNNNELPNVSGSYTGKLLSYENTVFDVLNSICITKPATIPSTSSNTYVDLPTTKNSASNVSHSPIEDENLIISKYSTNSDAELVTVLKRELRKRIKSSNVLKKDMEHVIEQNKELECMNTYLKEIMQSQNEGQLENVTVNRELLLKADLLNDNEGQLNRIRNTNEKLCCKITAMEPNLSDFRNLETLNDTLTAEVLKLKLENDNIKQCSSTELDTANVKRREHDAQHEHSFKELTNIHLVTENLQSKIDTLEDNKDWLEKSLLEQQEERQDLEQQMIGMVKQLEEFHKLKSAYNILSSVHEQIILENDALSNRLKGCSEVNQILNIEHDKLKQECSKHVSKYGVLEEELDKSVNKYNSLSREQLAYVNRLEKLEGKLSSQENMNTKLVEVGHEKKEWKEDMFALSGESESISSKLNEINTLVDEKFKHLYHEKEQLNKMVVECSHENTSLTAELSQTKNNMEEKIAEQMQQKESLEAAICSLSDKYKAHSGELEQTVKYMEDKIVQLNEKEKQFEENVLYISNENASLRNDLDKAREFLTEKQVELTYANTQHEMTIRALSDKNKSLNVEMRQERDSLEDKLKKLNHENEQLHTVLSANNIPHTCELDIQDMDTALPVAEQTKKIDSLKCESFLKENQSLERSGNADSLPILQDLKDSIENLQREKVSLKNEYDVLKTESFKSINDLKAIEDTNALFHKEKSELLKSYNILRKEHDLLRNAKHELENELASIKLELKSEITKVDDRSCELTMEDINEIEDLKSNISSLKHDIKDKDIYVRKLEEHLLHVDRGLPDVLSTPQPKTSSSLPEVSKSFIGRKTGWTDSSRKTFSLYQHDAYLLHSSKTPRQGSPVQICDLNKNCVSESIENTKEDSIHPFGVTSTSNCPAPGMSLPSVPEALNRSDEIKSEGGVEGDGHCALKLKQCPLVDEISQLKRDLRETKAIYTHETVLLTEALEHENALTEFMQSSGALGASDQNSSMSLYDLKNVQDSNILQPAVESLKEQNQRLKVENERLLSRMKDQEGMVSELKERLSRNTSGIEDMEEVFGRQLALLQKQREELLDRLHDCELESSRLSIQLGEKAVMEDSLRREKDILIVKLDEKGDIETELHEKQLQLEGQKLQQRYLEDLVYQKDINEQELMKQKRLLEQELLEIESKYRDREENLSYDKNQLLDELRVKSPRPNTHLWDSEDCCRSVCSDNSLVSDHHIGRLEVTLEDVEKQHLKAVQVLRDQLKSQYDKRETQRHELHTGTLPLLHTEQSKQVQHK